FLESNQVPKETIHVYRTQYEQGLVRARQLLESDLPEERRLAVEKLKYLPFQTPEVRSLLLEIGERESVSLNKYAAARAAIPSANGRISTEHLNGSESEAFVNFASAVTRERVHEAAEKTEDKLHESVLRPPQKGPRWFDGSQNPVSSRTARGLDAYYFANHVYGLPEVNLEEYLKNKGHYTKSFIEERNNWESGLRAGWQVRESVADPKTGLKAAVYSSLESKSQRSKVYAFGGTECKKDCMADVGLGQVQVESPHFQRLVESAATDIAEGGDVLITGHSLGGGLAQVFTVFAAKRAREIRESWSADIRKQTPPGQVATVTWQAFGAAGLVKTNRNYSPWDYFEVTGINKNPFPKDKEELKIPVQIENYRLPGEPISLVGQFLGPLYDIGGGDPKSKMSRFPSFSKHFLAKSVEPAFIKNGLETATLSTGFQIPEGVVSFVKGTIGVYMAKRLEGDFVIQWKDYFSAAMKAREEWERRFGYQRDDFQPSNDLTQIEPQYLGFNYQTPWLKRELLVLAEQAPPQLREWAERVLRVTEDSIQKLREQKRSSPFKKIPANDRP
ncbi:MAG: hypothetical protein ACKOA8_13620, partial [Deltaproteobacteria bacterium]